MAPQGKTEHAYSSSGSDNASNSEQAMLPPPPHEGWRAWYYNAYTQVILLGFVCFMGPGLYNALNGLGGGGRVDTKTNANANAVHYACFAFFAFFAGYVWTLLIDVASY